METKFAHEYESEYSEYVSIINRTIDFTSELKRLLGIIQHRTDFIDTCLNIADISYDNVNSILLILKDGYIAQAQASIRFYLELSHLFFFLYKNPERFQEWKNGEEVRPQEIGKFFAREKLQTWFETYEELSGTIIHPSFLFVSKYYGISPSTPKDELQSVLVGRILLQLAYLACKVNHVLCQSVRPFLGSDFQTIVQRYNGIENSIMNLVDDYLVKEKKSLKQFD